jgi:hypothetical protein
MVIILLKIRKEILILNKFRINKLLLGPLWVILRHIFTIFRKIALLKEEMFN